MVFLIEKWLPFLFILITDGKCLYMKPNGTIVTPEELFEFFGKIIKLIVENMHYVDSIKRLIDSSSEFPYGDLIDLCPKFSKYKNDVEDPIEFFQFMCAATKPLQNENDDASVMCTITVHSYYRCNKCEIFLEDPPNKCQSVNLLLMIQKE